MKRFYCTICGYVKRVRTLPLNTTSVGSMTPGTRTGVCDRHDAHRVHPARIGPSPRVDRFAQVNKPFKVAAPTKSKNKGAK